MSTPAGRPLSTRIAARASADSGASDDGRRTTGQPAASGGGDSTSRHGQREVPGRDDEARPDRLTHDEVVDTPLGGHRVAPARPQRLLRVPLQVLGGEGHLRPRLGQRLAHLQRDQVGHQLRPLPQERGGPPEDLRAPAGRERSPGRPTGARRVEGLGAVPGCRVRDLAEGPARRRVLDLQTAAARAGRRRPSISSSPGTQARASCSRPVTARRGLRSRTGGSSGAVVVSGPTDRGPAPLLEFARRAMGITLRGGGRLSIVRLAHSDAPDYVDPGSRAATQSRRPAPAVRGGRRSGSPRHGCARRACRRCSRRGAPRSPR